jgi:hypothetical protein
LIDGLAAEIIRSIPTATMVTNKVIYAKDVARIYNMQEAEFWSECFEQVVCKLVYPHYDFIKSKRPPSSVNRHGILHGRVIGYGTELNSYRVILLLSVMANIALKQSRASNP